MSKRIFNKNQINILNGNQNVTKCSERSISYSNDFKIKAVKQYHEEGLGSREIFELAGFDINTIGKDSPNDRLVDWNNIYKRKGIFGFEREARGRIGRPRKNELVGEDKIKRLEAEVAYLKAENDFLVKLRAKRSK